MENFPKILKFWANFRPIFDTQNIYNSYWIFRKYVYLNQSKFILKSLKNSDYFLFLMNFMLKVLANYCRIQRFWRLGSSNFLFIIFYVMWAFSKIRFVYFHNCCNLKLQFGPIFEISTFDFGVKFVKFPRKSMFFKSQYLPNRESENSEIG